MMETERLPDPDVIRLTGADRVTWLQGLVSNDVRRAAPDSPVYAALLTPQGRFLFDLMIWADAESLLLETTPGRAADLITALKRYRLRARVELTDESGQWQLTVGAGAVPSDAARDPRHPALGWRRLARRGGDGPAEIPAGWDARRLACGVPLAPVDLIPNESLLIEANFDRLNGVDFTKGCYMGQEITARMHHRDLTKRRLMILHGDHLPPAGTPLFLNGAEIGVMRSHRDGCGLALLKLAAAGQTITSADGHMLSAKPVKPPVV